MKADVLALAQDLANAQASATNLDQFYDDVVKDVSKGGLFNVLEIVAASANVARYTKPARISDILALFYDDVMLSLVTLRELEATTPGWRLHTGRPVAWLIEDLSHEEFQLYPVPTVAPGAMIPVHGAPLGLDYPVNTMALLGTEKRQDMPDWLDLPLALVLLGREYSHPSPHQDKIFAEACRSLGTLLLSMVA